MDIEIDRNGNGWICHFHIHVMQRYSMIQILIDKYTSLYIQYLNLHLQVLSIGIKQTHLISLYHVSPFHPLPFPTYGGLLRRGFECLEPGGTLVYSTCSLNPLAAGQKKTLMLWMVPRAVISCKTPTILIFRCSYDCWILLDIVELQPSFKPIKSTLAIFTIHPIVATYLATDARKTPWGPLNGVRLV